MEANVHLGPLAGSYIVPSDATVGSNWGGWAYRWDGFQWMPVRNYDPVDELEDIEDVSYDDEDENLP